MALPGEGDTLHTHRVAADADVDAAAVDGVETEAKCICPAGEEKGGMRLPATSCPSCCCSCC